MEKNKDKMATLGELIEAAKKEDWSFVDGNIDGSHVTSEQVSWALGAGLLDEDKNVRDLAATVLDVSDEKLDAETVEKLEKNMISDTHHIVRFRLAIALYKRGIRNAEVERMMQEAKNDPDVGQLASNYI